MSFETESGIPVKALYTASDLDTWSYAERLGSPGRPPFTRGTSPNGYREQPWVIGLYSGFGSAADANARYRTLLEHGVRSIDIALDLPTQVGLDSDAPEARGEVGKVGVAIDTLQDFEDLLHGIPLDAVDHVGMVANAMSPFAVALFVALGDKQRVPRDRYKVSIQNDVLKEFVARGTYIFPPGPSHKLTVDVIEYCVEHAPHWVPLQICGAHLKSAGATSIQEVAFAFSHAFSYLDAAVSRGIPALRILANGMVFLSTVGMNLLEEVAKIRAARRAWSRLVSTRYGVSPDTGGVLRFRSYTAGYTETRAEPLNNVVRVALEALAAVLGGSEYIGTHSWDEAVSIPRESAAVLALRTQQILAHETGLRDTVDPLGGAYFLEYLTDEIDAGIVRLVERIDRMGGAVTAVESGYIQQEIADSAYRFQLGRESGERVLVGVNRFKSPAAERREADPQGTGAAPSGRDGRPVRDVRAVQVDRLNAVRARRDAGAVKTALDRVRRAAAAGENVVPSIVEATAAYTSLGEVMSCLREVYGDEYQTSTVY